MAVEKEKPAQENSETDLEIEGERGPLRGEGWLAGLLRSRRNQSPLLTQALPGGMGGPVPTVLWWERGCARRYASSSLRPVRGWRTGAHGISLSKAGPMKGQGLLVF